MKFILLMVLVACNSGGDPKDAQTKGVKIHDDGALIPISGTLSGQGLGDINLGEYLKGSGPKYFDLEVRNDSKYSFTNLSLEFLDLLISNYSFVPDTAGEKYFPGFGGTCGTTLPSGQSCIMKLQFVSNRTELVTQQFKIKYKNIIGPTEIQFSATMLSGSAARLIFSGEGGTQFYFGQLIGSAETPVVERTVNQTYTKVLTVTNSGDLTARSLTLGETETCRSTITNLCPVGYGDVHIYNSTCGGSLKNGETCQLTIEFTPKNQDPIPGPTPAEITEIIYSAVYTYEYIKDPFNRLGNLSGYFSTYSTQIQANFTMSVNTLNFTDPVVVGNRVKNAFKITNTGFAAGPLVSFQITDDMNVELGRCRRPNALSKLVICYDPTYTTGKTLADLSFFLEDTLNCFGIDGAEGPYIPVDGACLFNLVFQPSNTYLTDQSFDLRINLEFDSRWQETTNIVTNHLFSSTAQSTSPSQISIQDFEYDNVSITNFVDYGDVRRFNMGRIALVSQSYPNYLPMRIRVQNMGTHSATQISFRDGYGVSIPFNDDNPSGVNLGTNNPRYYASAMALASNCRVITSSTPCTVVMNFSPFGMGTDVLNEANMFDGDDGIQKYKSFFIDYTNGSRYSDSNLESLTPDIPPQTFEVQLTASLIQKGLLQPVNVTNTGRFFSPNNPAQGDVSTLVYLFRNIGTGPIDYIAEISAVNHNVFNFVTTPVPAIHGANFDCLNIIDFDYSGADTLATINARSANWDPLPVEQSCALSIEARLTNLERQTTSLPYLVSGDLIPYGIHWSRQDFFGNPDQLWMWSWVSGYYHLFRLRWFDGDETDPSVTGLPATDPRFTFGNYTNTSQLDRGVTFRQKAHIAPTQVLPWTSAVAYRPGYNRAQLDHNAVMVYAADVVSEAYLYGPTDVSSGGSPIITSQYSSLHAAGMVDDSYDYTIHFGTFLTGETAKLRFQLNNFGVLTPNLVDLSFDILDPTYTVTTALITGPMLLPQAVAIDFTPSVSGTFESILNVEYQTGVSGETMQLKFRLIAQAVSAATEARPTVHVANYTLGLSDTLPPVESEDPAVGVPLTIGHITPTDQVVFEYVMNNSIGATSGYDKKRLYIRNNTPFLLRNINVAFTGSTAAYVTLNPASSGQLTIQNNTCAAGINLASLGGQCYIDIKYQPNENAVDEDFAMMIFYELENNQFIVESVDLDFRPQAASKVIPTGLAVGPITGAGGITLNESYRLNPGGTVFMTSNPRVLTWEFPAVNAATSTKASFLKAYQDYLVAEGLGPVTNTTRPSDPADYNYSSGGRDYAIIYKTKYPSLADRFVIRATKACLVGDDDEGDDFKNGFNAATVAPCYFHVTVNLDLSYMSISMNVSNQWHMTNNYVLLPYYSFYRSSLNVMVLYFSGNIKPDTSTHVGGPANVAATSAKDITFTWNAMTEANPGVGAITGYRVFITGVSSQLGSNLIYNGTLTYRDVATESVTITTGLNNNYEYYLRVYPIRYNAAYTGPPTNVTVNAFAGLGAGYFLSESNFSTFSVIIPPVGTHYFHTPTKIILKEDVESFTPLDFNSAKLDCSSNAPLVINDGGTNKNAAYKMLTTAIWSIIEADIALDYTNYSGGVDPLLYPHWMDNGTFNIDTELSGVVGYDPGADSQDLNTEGYYYIRSGTNRLDPVPKLRGGLWGTYSNLTMFIDPTYTIGLSRCYVDVSSI